ncbi:MAG TPA: NAD(P)H-binding protein [Terriglobia bacterium]|nr:NAD(P)H-binding protein [Terriglobia bacterium]
MGMKRNVFITGGTGYMGRGLIAELLKRGHQVRALVRPGSEKKLPAGCIAVVGDALKAESYAAQVPPADTFVQLVGIPSPNPSKAQLFREVDLASGLAGIAAAKQAGVKHFVYVSVAQPAPIMQAYIQARAECEEALRRSGMGATILRPWYVLGPGHRWPCLLLPMYAVASLLPGSRDTARRLGLVTLRQMIAALAGAVESPVRDVRVLEVPAIRDGRLPIVD